jgi:hypothetical protein
MTIEDTSSLTDEETEREAGPCSDLPVVGVEESSNETSSSERITSGKAAVNTTESCDGPSSHIGYKPKRSDATEKKSILKHTCNDVPIRKQSTRISEPGYSEPTGNVQEDPKNCNTIRKKRVKFSNICIRNYEQCIGDNPAVTYGTPISLDWAYEELIPLDLEQYEATRGRRRTLRQLMMNYYDRRNLLCNKYGYSEAELDAAEKQTNTIRRNRSLTRALLPASKVQELVYSAARKTKRIWPKKSKSKNDDLSDNHQQRWLDS